MSITAKTYLEKYDNVPYDVLKMLTESINYGGRITDDKDMRTAEVIMNDFYRPEVLQEGWKFSPSGVFCTPEVDEESPHESYINYINSLPINAGPEVFGMHENANLTFTQNEVYDCFDTILSLQAGSSSGVRDSSREEQICQIARVIEAKLPNLYDEEGISMAYPVKYKESMNTVLVQEVKRYNKLLIVMKNSLVTAQRALQGLEVMSSELEILTGSLFDQKVPKEWEMYPSLKPLQAWVQDLMDRLDMFTCWVNKGTPVAFWMSGFFFPQAFVTGTKQNFARKYGYAIDTVSFDFKIEDNFENDGSDVDRRPTDGSYIFGLFLEGAKWSKKTHTLMESTPKELYSNMPVIHLLPAENRKLKTSGVYHCPVYKELTRRGALSTTGHSTNFVMWMEIPSGTETIQRRSLVSETNLQTNFADSEKWVKAGVALFCALRY